MRDDDDRTGEEHSGTYTVLSDRNEIKRWANDHDVIPVTGTGTRQPELVHRDETRSDHEKREWDAFLDDIEDQNLVLAYRDTGGGTVGEYQLVRRTEVVDEHGEMAESIEKELLEGETVETEVTEREVIETEVIETATIESKLVDSEVVDSEIVDTEIIDEELVGVGVREMADAEVVDESGRTFFDGDQAVQIEEEGTVVLEIDETRLETEEQIEVKTIESRVVADDVEEETNVEDESFDIDIDSAGIHEHLEKSDLLGGREGEIVEEQYVETEFDEDDVARSTLTTHSTVENVVDERKTVLADISDVTVEDSHLASSEVIETNLVEPDTTSVSDVDTRTATGTEPSAEAGTTTGDETTAEHEGGVEITSGAMGRSVEMPDGTKIGMVSDVDEDDGVFYIDQDPSITAKIKARLQWGDEEEALRLTADQIREVRSDAVVVKQRDRT